jgi:hypothetical protein
MGNQKQIQKELDSIAKANDNLLRPIDIVEFAKDKTTALHTCFEWDNKKASQEYRLWQAREIISVYVRVIHKNTKPVRAYVSLMNDRKNIGGGYRDIEIVLKDEYLRGQLLNEALDELERFREKYKQLQELSEVFTAIRHVRKRKKSVA